MTIEKPTDGSTAEPFLSRWARLKQSEVQLPPEATPAAADTSIDAAPQQKPAEDARPERVSHDSRVTAELPSVDSLTPESDFSPFMAKDVDMQLRNQAMKKLFTDPHYNVMDRLDIYIDDYSVHTPLPLEVIRQMSIAKTLGLFDDDEKTDKMVAGETVAPNLPQSQTSAVQPPLGLAEAPSSPAVGLEANANLTPVPASEPKGPGLQTIK